MEIGQLREEHTRRFELKQIIKRDGMCTHKKYSLDSQFAFAIGWSGGAHMVLRVREGFDRTNNTMQGNYS